MKFVDSEKLSVSNKFNCISPLTDLESELHRSESPECFYIHGSICKTALYSPPSLPSILTTQTYRSSIVSPIPFLWIPIRRFWIPIRRFLVHGLHLRADQINEFPDLFNRISCLRYLTTSHDNQQANSVKPCQSIYIYINSSKYI